MNKILKLPTWDTYPLARRVMVIVILWSGLFILVIAAAQVFLDYRQEMDLLEARLQQVRINEAPSLANSVWHFDQKQIGIQLQGMLNLQDLRYLELRVVDGPTYTAGQAVPAADAWSQTVALDYSQSGKTFTIGQLTIVADRRSLQQRVRGRLFGVLLSEGIQIFLLAGFILFIVEQLFARPLNEIVRYTETLDLEHLEAPLVLKHRWLASAGDELARVALTLNEMRRRLVHGVAERQRAEEALRESEERYRLVLENSMDAILLTAPDGSILSANPAACEMFQRTEEEICRVGRNGLVDINDPRLPILLEERTRTGKARGELTMLRKDGAMFPVELSTSVFGDRNNEKRTSMIIRDITERKRTEDALKETERVKSELLEKLNAAQQIAMIGSWEWDLQTNHVWWSDETYRIFGVTPQDFVPSFEANGKFIHPDDFASYGKVFEYSLQTGEPLDYDFRLVANDGVLKHCHAMGKPIDDDSGQPIRFIGTIMDITERKQAEQLLKEREALLNEVGTIAKVGGWEMDMATGKATWSEGTYDIVEIDYDKPVPGLHEHVGYYLPEYREMIENKMKTLVETQQSMKFEAALKTAKGNIKWCQAFGEAVVKDGKLIKLRGTFQDITERKQAEEAIHQLNAELEQRVAARTAELQAVNRELETFTYSVSHDLKAPLRGIDGYSRLLMRGYADRLDDEGKFFVATIRTATERMNQLIDDLLTYSRLERRAFTAGSVEVHPLIQTLVTERAEEIRARDITLTMGLPDVAVIAEPEGLAQALRNLLDNALKFTRTVPHARIEIGGRELEKSCILWVRDNGAGFDMKYHDRIFEIFQRLQRDEDYPGTGVGLAIVSKAMQRMGGRVWAESAPGAGATFFLEIPK